MRYAVVIMGWGRKDFVSKIKLQCSHMRTYMHVYAIYCRAGSEADAEGAPLGGFQQLYPCPDAKQQPTYDPLLQLAADVFERNSVWSKTQSSLQQLQVSTHRNRPCRSAFSATAS